MELLKRTFLVAVLFHFVVVTSSLAVLPALKTAGWKLAETLFDTAWDELNPINSMEDQIEEISKEVKEIRTHLGKIEIAIMFGDDVLQIEHLVYRFPFQKQL